MLPLIALIAAVPLEVAVAARGDAGRIYCALWSDPAGFPVKRDLAAYEGRSISVRGGRARLAFAVRPGTYAMACFHDENDNHRLDTGLFGIPSEGTGASNDAPAWLGPPRFEDAKFTVTSTTKIELRMRYR